MQSATRNDDEPTAASGEPGLRAALHAVYSDRFTAMARFAAARLGDGAAGEDAVNDAFVVALQRLDSVRDPQALERWMWSILVNETRRERRRRSRRRVQRLPDEPGIAAPAAPEIDPDMRRRVRRLPERQRTVLFLRYYGDLTNAQIATLLDIAPGTVGATLHQAHAALREALDNDGDRDG